MSEFGLVWEGRELFQAGLEGKIMSVHAGTRRLVGEGANTLRDIMIQNASTGQHDPGEPHIPGTGPGPNIVSGNLISSIEVNGPTFTAGEGYYAEVGPNLDVAVYARALEYGLWQAPDVKYPYVEPALDEFATGWAMDSGQIWEETWLE